MKYTKGEALCKGGCRRMTRSAYMNKADHPNTVVRKGRGLCNRCYEQVTAVERKQLTELKFPLLPCTSDGCDVMTRSPKDNGDLAPGTRRRVSGGRCTECYKAQHVKISPSQVEATRTELTRSSRPVSAAPRSRPAGRA